MTAFNFEFIRGTYAPTMTPTSINFYKSDGVCSGTFNFSEVKTVESFLGKITLSYDVVITYVGYQIRIRTTGGQYMNDMGFFSPWYSCADVCRFESSSFKDLIGTSFHVVEEYNTNTGAFSWTIGSTKTLLSFTPGTPIQLKFSDGDDTNSFHAPTVISNITLTVEDIPAYARNFGVIIQ